MLDPALLSVLETVGLTPETVGYISLLVLVASWLSRIIPDSTTGPLGWLRKLAGIVGLQASNRVEPGLTESQAIRSMLHENPEK